MSQHNRHWHHDSVNDTKSDKANKRLRLTTRHQTTVLYVICLSDSVWAICVCVCAGLSVCLCSCRRQGTQSRLCLWCSACQTSLHLQRKVWKCQLCNLAHSRSSDSPVWWYRSILHSHLHLKIPIIVFDVVVTNITYNPKKWYYFNVTVASFLNTTKYCWYAGHKIFIYFIKLLCVLSLCCPFPVSWMQHPYIWSVILLHSSSLCSSTAGCCHLQDHLSIFAVVVYKTCGWSYCAIYKTTLWLLCWY